MRRANKGANEIARDQKSNKTGGFAAAQITLRSRRATDIVVPLNEAQRRSQIVRLTISGKACNEDVLIIDITNKFDKNLLQMSGGNYLSRHLYQKGQANWIWRYTKNPFKEQSEQKM